MAYVPLALPAHLSVHQQAVSELVDPLFSDIHSMLRLPVAGDDGLRGGCNLTCALSLLSIVAGVGETLMHAPTMKSSKARGGFGLRFNECLRHYYPWDLEPGPRDTNRAVVEKSATKALYNAFRNPLTHSLGRQKQAQLGIIKVAKSAMREGDIEQLEQADTRPASLPHTLAADDVGQARTKTVLNVPAFYWGVRQLVLRTLEGHPTQSQALAVPVPANQIPTASAADPQIAVTVAPLVS